MVTSPTTFDVQGVGVVAAHGAVLVLNEVVARSSGVGRAGLGQCGNRGAVELGERLDDVELVLIGLAFDVHIGELLQLGGGHLSALGLGAVLAVLDVGEHAVGQITGEDLIHLVGVILILGIRRERNCRIGGGSRIFLRHGGGGAGDSGDGHCCGCCHSDEAFENLIHCSPFLSFSINLLKSSLFSNVFNYFSVIELLPRRQWSFVLRTIPSSSRRVHCRRLLTFRASPAVATDAMATSNPVAKVFIFPSPPVPGNTTPG